MLPMRCFTCGTLLGDIQLIHEEEIKKIDSSKLIEADKNKKKEDLIKFSQLNLELIYIEIL
jgi:DNA-directed RNA polymerase subunit N (RpoN/RPB10)